MTPIGACPTATSSANEEIVKKISNKKNVLKIL